MDAGKEPIMATPSSTNLTGNGETTHLQWRAQRSYYAEVSALALDEQSQLVELVIRFAFETLGVRHLEVRVCGAEMAVLAAPTSTHGL
jgi:hypothetical protein